jgi:hypothetical protein
MRQLLVPESMSRVGRIPEGVPPDPVCVVRLLICLRRWLTSRIRERSDLPRFMRTSSDFSSNGAMVRHDCEIKAFQTTKNTRNSCLRSEELVDCRKSQCKHTDMFTKSTGRLMQSRSKWCFVWLSAAVLMLHAPSIQARPLNDTGETRCSDGANFVPCSNVQITHPGQDARYGRDVAAGTSALPAKIGFGTGGFDFTKIGNDGVAVPQSAGFGSQAGQYICIRDNVTGLLWNLTLPGINLPSGLSIQWGDGNPATNGGFAGGTLPGVQDTGTMIFSINNAQNCGRSNWRLPTVREMLSTLRISYGNDCGATVGAPEFGWPAGHYWTSQTVVGDVGSAYAVAIGGANSDPSRCIVVTRAKVGAFYFSLNLMNTSYAVAVSSH